MNCSPSLYESINQAAAALVPELDKFERLMENVAQLPPAEYAEHLPRSLEAEDLNHAGETFLNLLWNYISISNNNDLDPKLDPAIEQAERAMRRYQKIIAAIHEASHAVIACIVGIEVGSMDLNPTTYLNAAVRILLPEEGTPFPPQWAERVVVTGWAGYFGSLHVVPMRHAKYGAQQDEKMIHNIAEQYTLDELYIKQLGKTSYTLVFWAFPIIFLVATALLQTSHIEPARLRMLYITGNRALHPPEREQIEEQLALLTSTVQITETSS